MHPGPRASAADGQDQGMDGEAVAHLEDDGFGVHADKAIRLGYPAWYGSTYPLQDCCRHLLSHNHVVGCRATPGTAPASRSVAAGCVRAQASRIAVLPGCVYTDVVLVFECPRMRCTLPGSDQPSGSAVAQLCLIE